MIRNNILKILLPLLICLNLSAFSQKTSSKPYHILTRGKEVTIKSSKTIKEVMVWTSTGYRIVENRSVNANSFSFEVKVNSKIIFLMIHYEGSKPYTEKLGI